MGRARNKFAAVSSDHRNVAAFNALLGRGRGSNAATEDPEESESGRCVVFAHVKNAAEFVKLFDDFATASSLLFSDYAPDADICKIASKQIALPLEEIEIYFNTDDLQGSLDQCQALANAIDTEALILSSHPV